jgi:hypothetical protein
LAFSRPRSWRASEAAALLTKISGDRRSCCAELDQYYTGTQGLSYLSPEVQRAVRGRLKVAGGQLAPSGRQQPRGTARRRRVPARCGSAADDSLWRIWQANDLDEASQMAIRRVGAWPVVCDRLGRRQDACNAEDHGRVCRADDGGVRAGYDERDRRRRSAGRRTTWPTPRCTLPTRSTATSCRRLR